MKEYHLHIDDYTKLQLDIHAAKPYCKKHEQHCYVPHRHSFFQIIWFKNKGKHHIDYQEYEHEENTIFFLSSGQVHHFCKDSENAGYLFHFNEIFLSKNDQSAALQMQYRLFNELGNPYVQIPESEIAEFQFLSNQLNQEITVKKHNYREQLYYYFQILLLKIERLKQKEAIDFIQDPHFELAIQFKKAIENNKHQFSNVSYFSQLLGVSEKTLSTISKRYFQTTPANFIHQKRILEAKRLLSNSNLSIKEIAFTLGFEQPTYFTKYFKKQTQLTPKAFQQQFR